MAVYVQYVLADQALKSVYRPSVHTYKGGEGQQNPRSPFRVQTVYRRSRPRKTGPCSTGFRVLASVIRRWERADVTSWATSTSGYDPRKFYVAASDKKGHSAKYQVPVPTTVAGEISKLVQSGFVEEYGSAQDFIRDAIIHRLQFISELVADGELQRRITLSMLHANALLVKQQREQFKDLMRQVGENCNYYLTAGRVEELREYVSELLDQAEVVPEAHRSEYIGELEGFLKRSRR